MLVTHLHIAHDYAGKGWLRCMAPVPMQPQVARFSHESVRYEVFTGQHFRHAVTGEFVDLSWSERVITGGKVGLDTIRVRCRICPNCVKLNSWTWAEAAKLHHDEVMDAGGVTMAVTLTFSDEWFVKAWVSDRERRALDLEAIGEPGAGDALRASPAPGKFFSNNRHHIQVAKQYLGAELTKYHKRLREHADRKPGLLPKLGSWMGAFEFGSQNGRLHLHLLYHLKGDAELLRRFRRHANADWNRRVGFTKIKRVCTYAGCSYASKYIGKAYDAGYRSFFERLGSRQLGRFQTPLLTEQESVEFAIIKRTIALQRTRTRSSLSYRMKFYKRMELEPEVSDCQTGEWWCPECGSLDGCDCIHTDSQRTDEMKQRYGIAPECGDPPF